VDQPKRTISPTTTAVFLAGGMADQYAQRAASKLEIVLPRDFTEHYSLIRLYSRIQDFGALGLFHKHDGICWWP
jgi:hypothetical protein